ncbi:TPA: hypothetical protein HA242_03545 [Candidatus Woesearchaeota archaeon]|nr:hypothetical protein [Candidatus Woesearchaeota archaeon]HIG93042.1 hypothetical protein [Candidatus Woesearchaeota archaeon]HIH12769.1 hypothetical protein [Candidatus Woesearchaeota archaeon]
MTKIKIYVAGKVNPNSVFGTHDWRINFCKALEEKTGFTIHNLDPTKTPKENWDENDSSLVFGRDCYMISQADIVIVYLTDDISVGGSQEMLLAKYFHKPLIGLAPLNGKFNKDQKEIGGRQYINWKDPFVATTCDRIAGNIDEVALAISDFLASSYKSKDVSIITQNMEYYKNKLLGKDII